MPQHQLGPFPGSDPGPSTHPRGPPNLNQMSVVPPPQGMPQNPVPGGQRRLRTPPAHRTPGSDGSPGDIGDNTGIEGEGIAPPSPHEGVPSGRNRGGRAAGMSNDEWARQRKDNHVSQRILLKPCDHALFSEFSLRSLSLPTVPFLLQSRPSLACSSTAIATVVLRRHFYHLVSFFR